jgi:3-hydroxyacyl-CoA dehydrogenase / 3-hydroxy-2-methylbutyryl-CoA dehydrogenase
MDANEIKAVVTGGASGLGEGTVREIVKGGGQVAIFDMNEDRGHAIAAELGDKVIFCKVDVTSEEEVNAALDQAVTAFGGLNGVVNCAGIAVGQKITSKGEAHPLDKYRKVLDINVVGTFNVMRLAVLRMEGNDPNEDGERGAIVNTASIAAFDGQKGQAAYSASKGAIVASNLPIARDLGRSGIRINTIAPGLFMTPMAAGLGDEMVAELSKDIVFPKRFGKPSEYGRLAVFMLTHPYLNGETVRLDGAIRLP